MRNVKLERYAKLSVCKHDKAQTGKTHSGSVYSASWGNTCAGTILLHSNTIGWSGHVSNTIGYAEPIGWCLRVNDYGLGSGLRVRF